MRLMHIFAGLGDYTQNYLSQKNNFWAVSPSHIPIKTSKYSNFEFCDLIKIFDSLKIQKCSLIFEIWLTFSRSPLNFESKSKYGNFIIILSISKWRNSTLLFSPSQYCCLYVLGKVYPATPICYLATAIKQQIHDNTWRKIDHS